MDDTTKPVTADVAKAAARGIADRAEAERTALADREATIKPFEGHVDRECGEHRTVGPHRAWCFDCQEWCYPEIPCARCERPAVEAAIERIRRAVVDVYGEDYSGEDVAAEVERLFGHLSEHDINVGRLIGAKNEALAQAEAERDALKVTRRDVAEAARQARRIMTCHSRDWSLDAADAWLYALLVGWDCEIAEHADGSHDPIDCGGPNHLENFAERFGWTEGGIAKLRAQRQALAALDTPTPTEETGDTPC